MVWIFLSQNALALGASCDSDCLPLKGWLLVFTSHKVPVSPFSSLVSSCEPNHTSNMRERALPALGIWDAKFSPPFESITNGNLIKASVTDRFPMLILWERFSESFTETQFLPSWDQNHISLTHIQSNQGLYFLLERVITPSAISEPAA